MISEAAAYALVYSVLAISSVVACAAAYWVYKGLGQSQEEGRNVENADFWYSARGSQGWVSLGLSFFASSMGAWVLFAAPEVAILSGWWGSLGYAAASALPFAVLATLGPHIHKRFPDGFCLTDWVGQRFGRALQIYVAIVSVFYMWIYLVAELTSVGNLIRDMSGLDPLNSLIPVSVFTMLYTSLAGLPASIWTDRLQGIIMSAFVVITVISCYSGLHIKDDKWNQVSKWTDKGFESGVTLVLAIICAELLNMGNWQRVYAAENNAALRGGCAFGGALIFVTMLLFGLVGMLAKAQDLSSDEPTLVIPALAFFHLLADQSEFIKCLVFALAVCMVASSVDSLQNGLISVLSKTVFNMKLSSKQSLLAGQAFLVCVNVPAILFAVEGTKDMELGFNIINLFLIADLLAASIVMPIFMGLNFLATQAGTLAGCMSGVLMVMAFGWCEFGTFMGGMEMLTLMSFGNVKPQDVGLGASRTCLIFVLLPIVTGSVTYTVSLMDRMASKFEALTEKDPLDAKLDLMQGETAQQVDSKEDKASKNVVL
jgi:Na+/proline symporter